MSPETPLIVPGEDYLFLHNALIGSVEWESFRDTDSLSVRAHRFPVCLER
jgi:hypothetical protein